MTWYQEKAREEFKKIMEIHREKYGKLLNNYEYSNVEVISMTITVINMKTDEDFEIISEGLKELTGVKEVIRHNNGKITVSFDSKQTGLEHIVYKISKLGYRYINNF